MATIGTEAESRLKQEQAAKGWKADPPKTAKKQSGGKRKTS